MSDESRASAGRSASRPRPVSSCWFWLACWAAPTSCWTPCRRVVELGERGVGGTVAAGRRPRLLGFRRRAAARPGRPGDGASPGGPGSSPAATGRPGPSSLKSTASSAPPFSLAALGESFSFSCWLRFPETIPDQQVFQYLAVKDGNIVLQSPRSGSSRRARRGQGTFLSRRFHGRPCRQADSPLRRRGPGRRTRAAAAAAPRPGAQFRAGAVCAAAVFRAGRSLGLEPPSRTGRGRKAEPAPLVPGRRQGPPRRDRAPAGGGGARLLPGIAARGGSLQPLSARKPDFRRSPARLRPGDVEKRREAFHPLLQRAGGERPQRAGQFQESPGRVPRGRPHAKRGHGVGRCRSGRPRRGRRSGRSRWRCSRRRASPSERFCSGRSRGRPYLLDMLAGTLARECGLPVAAPELCTVSVNGTFEGLHLCSDVGRDRGSLPFAAPGALQALLQRAPVFRGRGPSGLRSPGRPRWRVRC